MERLLTISEAAETLGVSMQTMRKWDKDGKLTPTHTLGGHRRYREEDVNRIVAGMTDGPVKIVQLLSEALNYTNDNGLKKRIEKIIESVSSKEVKGL